MPYQTANHSKLTELHTKSCLRQKKKKSDNNFCCFKDDFMHILKPLNIYRFPSCNAASSTRLNLLKGARRWFPTDTQNTHMMQKCEVLIPFLGEISKCLLLQVPQACVDAIAGHAASRAGAREAPPWDLSGLCDVFLVLPTKLYSSLSLWLIPRESF